MPFKFQLRIAPVVGPIIFRTDVEVVGKDFIHWLLVSPGGVLLSQPLLSLIEGHLQVLNRSHLLDGTFQSVAPTRQQRLTAMDKPNGHVVGRL